MYIRRWKDIWGQGLFLKIKPDTAGYRIPISSRVGALCALTTYTGHLLMLMMVNGALTPL